MKTATLSAACFAACLVTSVSAQTQTVLHGKKVLIDKNGNVTLPVHPVVQPPSAPLVGGADSCVTPDVISGAGPFAFDNTVATTGVEGQNEGLCLGYATTGVTNDVWFTWTASVSGFVAVSMCGQATIDSRLAVYAGNTCPVNGSALACNDDFCTFAGESQAVVNVTAGNSYVIQIGNFPTATGGTGTFTINPYVPVPLDDCVLPGILSGPGTYPFDLTTATSGGNLPACGTPENDVWYAYTPASTGSATVTACGLTTSVDPDTIMAVYDGSSCPSSPELGCDDDSACGLESTVTWPITCGNTYMIQIGSYNFGAGVAGSFNISETGTQCGPTGVPYCFGDGTGTACPCGNSGAAGNGCASSVNVNGANLTTTGNSSLANDTLVLQASGMPNAACLYFQGTTQVSAGFGDGLRCAGGTVVRLLTKTNVNGASQYPGAGNPSVSVKGAVTAPGTRTYQTWYRNAAAFCTPSTFNLTNGVLVTWQ